MSIIERLNAASATTHEALDIFDALAPVELDFMTGYWKGEGFRTHHPMDGLLEAYHWYGKRFENPEDVHPLVFSTRRGGVACVNPVFMGPFLSLADNMLMPRLPAAGRLFQLVMPLFTTSKSRARLRMPAYRGKLSATMIYDQLPINDVFRQVDENTVFGIMDRKGMKVPFFFILRRARGG